MVDLNSNRDDILALVNKFKEEALVPMKVSKRSSVKVYRREVLVLSLNGQRLISNQYTKSSELVSFRRSMF